jgi:predicted nucleotidyltransferase
MTKLLECKFGSQVYGTATPLSDIDIGVVLLEPKEFIFGIANLTRKSTTIAQEVEGETDVRTMYLRRFLSLCAQGNPNVLEWLYTPGEHIDEMHPMFRKYVWDNRNLLLNKKRLVASHLGFAKSQVIRMRNHENDMGAKRRALYAQYGYDVKFASHALRLMYQLSDIMVHGKIRLPYTPDQQDILRAVKGGEWTLDRFDKYYEDAETITKGNVEKCDFLPNKTNFQAIAELLERFYREVYYPNTQFSVLDV